MTKKPTLKSVAGERRPSAAELAENAGAILGTVPPAAVTEPPAVTTKPVRQPRKRAAAEPLTPKLVKFPESVFDELVIMAGRHAPGTPLNHVIVEAVKEKIANWKGKA